jgi:hypothetical protein
MRAWGHGQSAGWRAILNKGIEMVEVFIEYTGQGSHRTYIAGGPFPDRHAAYQALLDYADMHHGSFRNLIQLIDAYGFEIQGAGLVRMQIRP